MPSANWRAFWPTVEIAGDSPRSPGRARSVIRRRPQRGVVRYAGSRTCSSRTGLLQRICSDEFDEMVDLSPARVRAHFSAWHREKDEESSRRRGNVRPMDPTATFMHPG